MIKKTRKKRRILNYEPCISCGGEGCEFCNGIGMVILGFMKVENKLFKSEKILKLWKEFKKSKEEVKKNES